MWTTTDFAAVGGADALAAICAGAAKLVAQARATCTRVTATRARRAAVRRGIGYRKRQHSHDDKHSDGRSNLPNHANLLVLSFKSSRNGRLPRGALVLPDAQRCMACIVGGSRQIKRLTRDGTPRRNLRNSFTKQAGQQAACRRLWLLCQRVGEASVAAAWARGLSRILALGRAAICLRLRRKLSTAARTNRCCAPAPPRRLSFARTGRRRADRLHTERDHQQPSRPETSFSRNSAHH